ncbi:uncharacterized protein AKAME5_001853200 [Lates japonicus]|uniref:Uncharacterized protein n=1 Tax=Lates japonicus TaxID=270547 RepID=A0AAD3N5T6_LATJO|nr:uncharacterized protein AKAME5_001853200 [Lates japonicus]
MKTLENFHIDSHLSSSSCKKDPCCDAFGSNPFIRYSNKEERILTWDIPAGAMACAAMTTLAELYIYNQKAMALAAERTGRASLALDAMVQNCSHVLLVHYFLLGLQAHCS